MIAEIEKTLHDWALDVTGRPVVFEPTVPDAPRPTGPYVSMLVAPMQRVGWDVHTSRDQAPEEGADVWDRVEGQRTVGVSVNVYRSADPRDPSHAGMGRVEDDAEQLVLSLSHARSHEALIAGHLGFNSVSEIRNFAEVVKQGWEERRQFDAVFNTSIESEQEVERIDSVEIHEHIHGATTIEVDAGGGAP